MEEQNSNAYSEALAVLKLLDDEEKLEKLPIEMLEVLKAKANSAYMPEFSREIPLDEQNISPEALGILSWIAMKYWNEEVLLEENKPEQIIKDEETNSEVEEEIEGQETKLKEDRHNNEINIEEMPQEEQTKDADSTLPVLYKDLKWYQRIKIKIIEFFNRIFKRYHIEEKNNEEEGNTL